MTEKKGFINPAKNRVASLGDKINSTDVIVDVTDNVTKEVTTDVTKDESKEVTNKVTISETSDTTKEESKQEVIDETSAVTNEEDNNVMDDESTDNTESVTSAESTDEDSDGDIFITETAAPVVVKKRTKFSDNYTRKTYHVRNDLIKKIAAFNKKTNWSQSDVINKALEDFFERVKIK